MPYNLPHGSPYPTHLLHLKAQEAALHRGVFREQVINGDLTIEELLTLASSDRILGRARIKSVIRWLPGIGAVKSNRILTESGIAPDQRLSSLSETSIRTLVNHPRVLQCTAYAVHQRRERGGA